MCNIGQRPIASRKAKGELFEVVVVFAIVEAALWTLGRSQLVLAGFAALAVIVFTLRSGRRARELGLTSAGFCGSFRVIPVALIIGGLGVLAAAHVGSLHLLQGVRRPVWHALLYAVWALVQQFLVQSFIFVRLESAFDNSRTAVILTAILFSVAHVPNAVLVPATAVVGLWFACVFSRYRNIYPLGIAHAVLGLAFAVSLPYATTHFMRVGAAMFMPAPR